MSQPNTTFPIIVHLDLDCFFVQVEQQKDPSLKGKPVAIQQHQDIICVSYEARALGLKKHTHPDVAMQMIPSLRLVHVPKEFGSKVTYHDYRRMSTAVFQEVCQFVAKEHLEKQGLDEAFLDLTQVVQSCTQPPQDLVGKLYTGNQKDYGLIPQELLIASSIVEQIRAQILEKTGLTCSAGISCNKPLSKLAANMHKPNHQTTILPCAIPDLLGSTQIEDVPGLKAKLGKEGFTVLQQLSDVIHVSDLQKYSKNELANFFGNKAHEYMYNIARGINSAPVTPKPPQKAVSVSMTLVPQNNDSSGIKKVLTYITPDLVCRLQEDLTCQQRNLQTSSCTLRCKLQNLSKEVHTTWALRKVLKKAKTQQQAANPTPGSVNPTNLSNKMTLQESDVDVAALVELSQKAFTQMITPYPVWSITWVSLSINFVSKHSNAAAGSQKLDTMFNSTTQKSLIPPTSTSTSTTVNTSPQTGPPPTVHLSSPTCTAPPQPATSPVPATPQLSFSDGDALSRNENDFFGTMMSASSTEDSKSPMKPEATKFLHCPICGKIQPADESGQRHINFCMDQSEPKCTQQKPTPTPTPTQTKKPSGKKRKAAQPTPVPQKKATGSNSILSFFGSKN
eukprot:TRINITY_DN63026_c0_g1_i2.p1 TRINITY_DN63026_c0_g1~~TRINITY_DN63026_c0_g1_i2.p1  ORF type:complete len:619 (+),score=60.40 TRINITY_DN63026_c0_g1_i2:40-1896(+)